MEHGLYMKHCKVEVYLLEFKLCLHPKLNEPVNMTFSRADTISMPCSLCRAHSVVSLLTFFLSSRFHILLSSLLPPFLSSSPADLEVKLRSVFDVEKDAQCRVWHRYMTSTYELLSDPKQSLQDAGLYNGQVRVCWLS